MSAAPETRRVPLMGPDKARDIAHALKGLSQSYAEACMQREASRAEQDSQWWLAYSISPAQLRPAVP